MLMYLSIRIVHVFSHRMLSYLKMFLKHLAILYCKHKSAKDFDKHFYYTKPYNNIKLTFHHLSQNILKKNIIRVQFIKDSTFLKNN